MLDDIKDTPAASRLFPGAFLRRLMGQADAPMISRTPARPISSETEFNHVVGETEEPVVILFDIPHSRSGALLEQKLTRAGGRERRFSVGRIDVAAMPRLPSRYGVTAVPALVVFRNGQAVARRLGDSGLPELENWLTTKL